MSSPDAADPRRGEIYWVDFNPVQGSEQAGRRPAVVVSPDITNTARVVIVCPLTTKQLERRRRDPRNVFVPAGQARDDSVILGGQIRTIDKSRLGQRVGALDDQRIREMSRALAIATGILRPNAKP